MHHRIIIKVFGGRKKLVLFFYNFCFVWLVLIVCFGSEKIVCSFLFYLLLYIANGKPKNENNNNYISVLLRAKIYFRLQVCNSSSSSFVFVCLFCLFCLFLDDDDDSDDEK